MARYRKMGLIVFLAAALPAAGAHFFDMRRLDRELTTFAAETEDALTVGDVHYETVSLVSATRDYLLFGPARGKVEVFTRSTGVADPIYAGVEYRLERADGAWAVIESGMCQGEECRTRAKAAFDRLAKAQP